MGQEPKKVDRRNFLYAGLGAIALVAIGAAAYIAMNPPVVTQTTTTVITQPTTTIVTQPTTITTTVPTTSVVTTTATKTIIKEEITCIGHSVFWPLFGQGELLETFAKDTGITVNYISCGHTDLREKVITQWLAGGSEYDAIIWSTTNLAKEYTKYMEPLDSYIDRDKHLMDYDDIYPSLIKIGSKEGHVYEMPLRTGTNILFYRKDLFEQLGINVPIKSWDEYLEMAKKLTLDINKDGSPDIYGAGVYGDAVYAYDASMDFIYGFGGHVLEEFEPGKWKCVLNSPQAIEGIQYYVDLYQKHKVCPPGTPQTNNEKLITAMQQELVSTAIMYAPYAVNVNDPSKSKVSGKVGYQPRPTKAGMSFPGLNWASCWGILINKASKKKEAAWEFIKFLTSKASDMYMALRGNGPIRASTFNSSQFREKFGTQWVETFSAQLEKSVPPCDVAGTPTEIRDLMGREINAAITGQKSVKETMEGLTEKINEILKARNYEI
ncbi:MAG: sugar ABC transporter substrate-binding protein [Nitrososphaeria archaeon]